MAKFRSEVDSLPLSWSTRGRRDTFASYHCCTLIHKRAQYLAFLSSALLALINRPPLRLTLAGEASDDPRNTMPIISDRSPAIGPFHLRQGRSEERRVGKECVSPGRSRRSLYH